MPRLEDVALSIASVMTREEKDQLKMFVTAMVKLIARSYSVIVEPVLSRLRTVREGA